MEQQRLLLGTRHGGQQVVGQAVKDHVRVELHRFSRHRNDAIVVTPYRTYVV